jgi:hypothetical protein
LVKNSFCDFFEAVLVAIQFIILSPPPSSKQMKIKTNRSIVLHAFLYGNLREEHRLRVFENSALRKILESNTEEVIREWRKLHNSYSSPNIYWGYDIKECHMGHSFNTYG